MKRKVKMLFISCLSMASVACGALALGNVASASADGETPLIALQGGASCRIKFDETEQANTGGIRFTADLDQTQWQALLTANSGAELSAGVIVVPTDYVTAAGGYKHSNLLPFAATNELEIADCSYTAAEIGTETEFAGSVINILGKNYTRDFSGIAYLKSSVEISGWESYDGAWYTYAAYDETKNVRNIYEVAYNAYNDRTASATTVGETNYNQSVTFNDAVSYSPYNADQRDILKGYLDGVADVAKNTDGDIVAMNNTAYYASPYTPEEVSTDNWLIENGNGVKAMLYGGEWTDDSGRYVSDGVRKTAFNVTDEGVKVHTLVKSETATVNDAAVTLIGDQVGYASPTVEMMSKMTLDYVAFNGNYEIGTYIDFYFQGNNMPQVMFFADEINGDITKNGGKGIICTNGLFRHEDLTDLGAVGGRLSDWLVWGPNRIHGTYTEGGHITMAYGLADDENSTSYPGVYPLLSQNGLKTAAEANYKYTVGMFARDGDFYVDVYLYNADDGSPIYHVQRKVTKKTLAELSISGSIVAYACVKGEGSETSFTYGLPYEGNVKYNGATITEDGAVSLTGSLSPGGVAVAALTSIDTSYVAFDGKYGLGTYMDFWFTGNNMPQVMFFADQINGDITVNGGTGVLLMNGMGRANASTIRPNELLAFGPNRISSTNSGYDSGVYLTKINATGTTNYPGDYPLLSQTGLSGTPDANYKYTVGMYGGTDGYLHIDIYLYNADDNTEIYHVDRVTKLLVSDMTVTSGSIVAYAGYKGGGSGSTTAETTVFKYSQPYTK